MAIEGGENGSLLRFAQLQSLVKEGFWHRLSSLKLNKFGIDDSPVPITGFYAPCSHSLVANHLTLETESLPADDDEDEESTEPAMASGNRKWCSVPGILYNTNTLEDFHALDKKGLLQQEANKIWEDIQSGKAMEDPTLLSRFLLISFADLKKWTFRYWFAFPALVLDPPATVVELKAASEWFTSAEAESVSKACNEWRSSNSTTGVPFFLVSIASDSCATVRHLKDWEACQGDGQKVLFGFYDPYNRPDNPGWPLRNLLALICSRWKLERVDVLCYRESRGFADLGLSLAGKVFVHGSTRDHQDVPNAIGWERDNNKAAPRFINLAKSMDPIRRVIDANDLNLKLMRWRIFPSLDIDKLASMKCLLLGVGTLGCQVARTLMGFGVRKITLLDNGKVAMSNPVRQSLFTFEDYDKYKALVAVKRLQKIFPAIEAEGVVMSIPMPGHPVTSQEVDGAVDDCTRLHNLIDSHDAIFLLTDTRESRWLPTLLCANANKIAITAALGFDSFLVMRHGPGPYPNASKPEAAKPLSDEMEKLALADREQQRLGCYFCNDVVQPTDSTSNRTLDQQCTVTRPGLAPMSGAVAVELFVNLLHHPDGIFAPANAETPLGTLPHQLRLYLHNFSQMTLEGRSFDRCTACCSTVVKEYRERGMEFLLQAINHPTYLADLTGLTELTRAANSFDIDWDDDDIGDDDELAEI